ncbi:hypothetical protein MPER_10238 [Moniliophthora perniciosa FA553]|nr:hypothetical protein MPER_10238 [Moniliophthora perniciosa FA553]
MAEKGTVHLREGLVGVGAPGTEEGDRPVEANNPGNNLHVSGLSNKVDTRDLEAAFAKVGRVSKASVVYDPHTRESRLFGFVTMETPAEVERGHPLREGIMVPANVTHLIVPSFLPSHVRPLTFYSQTIDHMTHDRMILVMLEITMTEGVEGATTTVVVVEIGMKIVTDTETTTKIDIVMTEDTMTEDMMTANDGTE